MRIECLLRRPEGTKITLGATEYHFRPDPKLNGAHVAFIADQHHAEALLRIKEAYRALDDIPVEPVTLDEAKATLEEAFPSRPFDHLLVEPKKPDANPPAPVEPKKPEPAPEPQPEPQPDREPDTEQASQGADDGTEEKTGGDAKADQAGGSEGDGISTEVDEEALRARFEEVVGRKPHARMRADTMQAQIEAALAERA